MGLGGAMIWSIDDDDFANGYPLVTKIDGVLSNPQSGPQLPPGLVPGSTGGPQTPQNWMTQMPDTLMLSQLNIPGTHDTCAILPEYINGVYNVNYPAAPDVNCQNWSLQDQLNHGIRYVDIRCRHIQDVFAIHHQAYFMGLYFGADVRDVCVNFLKANPGECIIMQVKREYDDANNTQTFEQMFDGYVRGFESFFYLDNHIPTLGEVRGKIVVVQRFNLDPKSSPRGLPLPPQTWTDNATFDATYTAANNQKVTFHVQDQYQLNVILVGPNEGSLDSASKWNDVSALLNQAKSDASSAWYINEASGTAVPSFTPANVADVINRQLYSYLAGAPFPNRLGTLLMDFPDDNMIGRIISLNMQSAAASAQLAGRRAA